MKSTKLLMLLMLIVTTKAFSADINVPFRSLEARSLGSGFNTRSLKFSSLCVSNDRIGEEDGAGVKTDVANEGTLDLDFTASQDEVAKKLGIEADGMYRGAAYEANASAKFLKASASKSFSLAYTYISDMTNVEYIESTRNRPITVLDGFKDILGDGTDNFFKECGDEFVSKRQRSARIFININVTFVSKTEKDYFSATFGVTTPIAKIQTGLESSSQKFSSSNHMTIKVMQQGGTPSQMGKILCPTNNNGQVDSECAKNAAVAVDCGFGDIKVCATLIKNAIAYANSTDPGKKNFPDQLEDRKDGTKFVVTAMQTTPYTRLGKPFTYPPALENEAALQINLSQLTAMFKKQYKRWINADELFNGNAPRLTSNQKSQMEVIRVKLEDDMMATVRSINTCNQKGYEQCALELDSVKALTGLDKEPSLYEIISAKIEALTRPESFVQFCDMASDESLRDVKTTMDSLKAYAVSLSSDEEVRRLKSGDQCAALNEWYSNKTILDLSDAKYSSLKIGDFAPITYLTNLEILKINGKNLKNINSINRLINLTELNLDDNLIDNLDALVSLNKLTRLSIKNNKISQAELDKLKALNFPNGSLMSIDARGNSPRLICPLIDKSQCQLTDFNNAISLFDLNSCPEMVKAEMSQLDPQLFGEEAVVSVGGLAQVKPGNRDTNGDLLIDYNGIQIITQDKCTTLTSRTLSPRTFHTVTPLKDGRVALIGGLYDNSIEVLTLKNNSSVSNLPIATSEYSLNKLVTRRAFHTSTLLQDGRILIVGGLDATSYDRFEHPIGSLPILASVEIFDPTTMKVENFGKLNIPRVNHTATMLKDGNVLIIGGYGTHEKMLNSAELIDVKNKVIRTVKGSLNVGRSYHNSFLLDNGNVVILGGSLIDSVGEGEFHGEDPTNYITTSIELFDVNAETFTTLKQKLDSYKAEVKVWPLSDGNFMIFGVYNNNGEFSRSVEIFDKNSLSLFSFGNIKLIHGSQKLAALNSNTLIIRYDSMGLFDQGFSMPVHLINYRPR